MAIDIHTQVKAGFLLRWMTVGQMKLILDGLQENDTLLPNRVGNLNVMRDDEWIGYIDFGEEIFHTV